jgi:hypothetical protein
VFIALIQSSIFLNTEIARKVTRLQHAATEHELRKLLDFQLYMLAAAPRDRERMERPLAKLSAFRAWRRLSQRIDGPARDASASHIKLS